MPDFVTVPDPVAGPQATGRLRYDRRPGPPSAPTTPLVLVGGMTQTVSSWGGQLRPLSRTRDVLAYEARGQGATALSLAQADLPRHVEDFVAMVQSLRLPTPVDLCGFSFGARVSLAIAATQPALVRRLVLSGLGLDRGVVGRLIVDGWIAALRTGDLEALARVSLTDIVGPDYLEAHAQLVEPMVRAVVQRNSFAGISALFQQTLRPPEGSPWTPEALAPRVQCHALVMGGQLDRLAPPDEVRQLAQRMGARYRCLPQAGHTIPIEAADAWREAVLELLDAPDPPVNPQ
ncbi:MAG: alpha/beta hydrolase [Myxococcota bacterium]